nr:probable manganese-transporting ATPase PDR2 [Tanacetum cinerariifolium]
SSAPETRVSQTLSDTSSFGTLIDDAISSRDEVISELSREENPMITVAFASETQVNHVVPAPSLNADDFNSCCYTEALLDPQHGGIERQCNMSIEDLDHQRKKGLKDPNKSRYKLLLYCSVIITVVAPLELPMKLSMVVNTSLIGLRRRDENTDMTSDDMEFSGVGGLRDDMDLETDTKKVPTHTLEIIASCHALVSMDNKLVMISGDEALTTCQLLVNEEMVEALAEGHDLCLGGDCFEMLMQTCAFVKVIPFVKLKQMMDEISKGDDGWSASLVKLGDTSMASSFSARHASVSPTTYIICQGHNTLVTTLQTFKVLGLNYLKTAYLMSVMHLDGVKLGDVQAIVSGLFTAAFFLFISHAVHCRNYAERPHANIFCFYIFLSLLGQFTFHMLFFISSIKEAKKHMLDECIDPTTEFKSDMVNMV